jgi:hypothetical protein
MHRCRVIGRGRRVLEAGEQQYACEPIHYIGSGPKEGFVSTSIQAECPCGDSDEGYSSAMREPSACDAN